ncbi:MULTISPECIES: arylsulfatase [unclassified Lentimonas]|uniref:sulfatase family protein n=1 Tax=unclassified Lentimonas TaxID=2630993 RepID=UPI0013246CF8|nr:MULTISPECIES: arylsulfatase [unclassified Lentimonas]CAA6692378.1 Choline-sulfatase (EC [Lentimonas sp. CC19]CAA6693944.1 Choline-sulfatase (EC [Lentimonas sp. CC10]CAA7072197.1 Choline-sulfatase (EC [Lentimonas sp. CC11]
MLQNLDQKYLVKLTSFTFVVGVVIASFSQSLTAAEPAIRPAKTSPNILIIYADDMGYGDMGANNPKSKIPTPNMDQLAASGMRFIDGHSSSGICTPSRYALLTGRHHWRKFHGITGSFDDCIIDAEQLTVPEMLKTKGYTTAQIGKWHLGMGWDAIRNEGVEDVDSVHNGKKRKAKTPDSYDWSKQIPNGPLAHGFDYSFTDCVINFPPYTWIENDKVVEAPTVMMDTKLWKPIKEGNWECRPGPMAASWDPYENIPTLTKKAVAYINRQAENEAPFFLYFAFPSPHAPIVPNDQFDGKSAAGPYGDFVYETDDSVGQILAALEASGKADNTLIIFTADNGPEHYAYERDKKYDHWSSGPFRGIKRFIYEGGHHVPYVVKWPGVTEAGAVSDALVSQIDIMATLAAVVDYELPKDQAEDSHNLLPLLEGSKKSVRTVHIHNTFADEYGIRQGDWVLINYPKVAKKGGNIVKAWAEKHGYPVEKGKVGMLYNLKEDIGQRHDVSDQYPEKVEAMQSLLTQIREQGYSAPHAAK